MNQEQILIWNKIQNFEIDDVDSSFNFTDRLARENDWSIEYALRAILGLRNSNLVNLISNSNSDKIFVIFGASHYKGFLNELKLKDSDYKEIN